MPFSSSGQPGLTQADLSCHFWKHCFGLSLSWPLGGDFLCHYFHSPGASQFSPAVNCCVLSGSLYLVNGFRHGEQRLNCCDGAAASLGKCIDSICIGQVGCFQRLQIFKAGKKSMRPSLMAFCRLQAVEFSVVISALNLVAIKSMQSDAIKS